MTSPPAGPRDGFTFNAEQDEDRLNKQSRDVWRVMSDRRWHTLREISARTGHPEASVSARLRDFRKPRFGQHTVHRQREAFGQGTFEYLLVPQWEKP